MTTKNDDTKEIKRMIDDETLEQLVENRPTAKRVRTTGAHSKKKKKRKKHYGLTALITVLGFVLVFVIFFIGSYIIFSSSPSESGSDTQKVTTPTEDEATIPDSKNTDDGDEKTFDSEVVDTDSENDDAVVTDDEENTEAKKPQTQPKPQPEKEHDKEDKKTAPTTQTDDKTEVSEKNTTTDKKPSDTTNVKPETPKKPATPEKPATAPEGVVEKNESSEGIILD